MDYDSKNRYSIVIEAKRNIFKLNIRELVLYKDLIVLFVKREFVSKYKQTILGTLWAVLQPILTSIVFTVIFGNIAKLSTADTNQMLFVPSFLFYMSGTILWTYFSSVVNQTASTFITNSSILGKVYFPRLVMPIATTLSNLIPFLIQFVLLTVMYLICIANGTAQFLLSPLVLLLPLTIFQLMILAMSVGLIISSLTTKYRDLMMLVSFGLQLWQYGTPIVYGLELIPRAYRSIYLLNPVTPIVLTFRYSFFGVGYFNFSYYVLGWCTTLVLLIVSIVLFNRIEATFMDTI